MRKKLAYIAYIAAIFIFAVLFWHNKVPWDPCAYMLTGRHLLGENTYYEALRAPVPSLILGTLGIYGYFAVTFALLGISAYIFARKRRYNPLLFIVLLLPALAWPYIVETGSEVLAFGFILLGAAISETAYAGTLFSLAFLSRYAFAYFIPFFLPWRKYQKDRNILLWHALGFATPLILWSAWQYAVYGHPLASYIDFLFVNSYLNPTSLKIPRIDLLLKTTMPTTILGLPGMDVWTGALLIVVLFFAGIAFVQWPRFYIPALLPLSLAAIRVKWPKNIEYVLAIANVAVAFLFVYPIFSWDSAQVYSAAAEATDANCTYISNVWVPLICEGVPATPPPPAPETDRNAWWNYVEMLREGYRAIVMRGVGFPAYMEDMNIYYENNIPVHDFNRFFTAGDGCVPPEDLWRMPENTWEMYSTRLQLVFNRYLKEV